MVEPVPDAAAELTVVEDISAVARLLAPASRVLMLGGTREAADLAAILVALGHAVTTSLAGRTREPKPVASALRIGGFGGVDGLAAHISSTKTDVLIDATHPFARQISAHAESASRQAGVKLIRLERRVWVEQPGDRWMIVGSLEAARDAIPAHARVLLALGRQHIAPFAQRTDVHFIIRMVDPPERPLPFAAYTLIAALPGTVDSEEALLAAHAIDAIVCRNSGGSLAYAKIEAARRLGLPVILISP
jgi:precorrin-6A/cobalt-precorrin-6A reductase